MYSLSTSQQLHFLHFKVVKTLLSSSTVHNSNPFRHNNQISIHMCKCIGAVYLIEVGNYLLFEFWVCQNFLLGRLTNRQTDKQNWSLNLTLHMCIVNGQRIYFKYWCWEYLGTVLGQGVGMTWLEFHGFVKKWKRESFCWDKPVVEVSVSAWSFQEDPSFVIVWREDSSPEEKEPIVDNNQAAVVMFQICTSDLYTVFVPL